MTTTTTSPIDAALSKLAATRQAGRVFSPVRGSHLEDGQALARYWFSGCEGFTVLSRKTSQSSWMTEAYPVADPDKMIADAAGWATNFDTYVRASTVVTPPKPKKRGTSADTLHVPGFMFDLDGAWGAHAAADPDYYPASPEEALRILEGFPPPSAIIWSGGGMYPMWKLNEPLQGDAGAGPLLKEFHSHWGRRFSERGWHLDNTSDTARIFRWPGTVNRKRDEHEPVVLLGFSGLTYDLDEILAELDPLPASEPEPTQTSAPTRVTGAPAGTNEGSPFDAIRCPAGQRFIADVLIGHGWEEVPGHANGGIDLTRPSNDKHGEQSSGLSLRIGGKHPTTGGDMTGQAYFFSSGAVDLNGETIRSGAYSLADTLAHVAHSGDRSATARFLLAKGWGNPQPRPHGEMAPPGVNPETGEVDGGPGDPLAGLAERMTAEERMLPERFWTARPVLEHIRQAAHSRIRSADLVLHGVLTRLCAYTPHTIEIPPLAGSAGSLNYFAIAIGPSGSGKSSGSSIPNELLPKPADLTVKDRPLGSGEGLAENFMGWVMEEDRDGKKGKVHRQVLHNVFVYGDEGAALTEMMERKGSTLAGALRIAWTGHNLGQANATAERSRDIPQGQYRLGLLVGFQPEVAAKLMADDVAGTPQRFMFASATDPNVPDLDDRPEWPGPIDVPKIPAPTWKERSDRSTAYLRHRMAVHDDIAREVGEGAVAQQRGQAEGGLDAHQGLHLLKVAGLLAILDGRLDINLEDWELARIVWDTSCRVRAGVLVAVKLQKDREEEAWIKRHATREHAAEAARGSARSDVERIAGRLTAYVDEAPEGTGQTRGELRRRLASTERHLVDAAISCALEHDWLAEDGKRYVVGGTAVQ